MKIRNLNFWSLLLLSFLINACAFKVSKVPANSVRNVNTIKEYSYAMVKQNVFTMNCVGCHGSSGGVNLESYAAIKAALPRIENAVFVNHSMPKNGSLDENSLQILRNWIDLGAPEGPVTVATPAPTLVPTYSSIREQIFLPHCASCHRSGGAATNVILDNYQSLLNSPRDLVLPRDSETSGLIMALVRTDDKQMPPKSSGASPLTSEQIATIKKWINDGALNN
jgi:mono/diheme cytochrome c family protein